jgi:hypothetical protein
MITKEQVKYILQHNKMKVIYVPSSKMYGYVGMNKQAAKVMHFPWHYGHKILEDKNLQGLQRDKTKVHETVEDWDMLHGKPYWYSHTDATQAEHLVHEKKLQSKPRKFKEYIY